jgi:hypothetical protein
MPGRCRVWRHHPPDRARPSPQRWHQDCHDGSPDFLAPAASDISDGASRLIEDLTVCWCINDRCIEHGGEEVE